MFTVLFWKAAAERAVRAAAAAVLSIWVVGDQLANALTLDYGTAAGVAVGAAVVSLLTSIVASNLNADNSPAFNHAENLKDK